MRESIGRDSFVSSSRSMLSRSLSSNAARACWALRCSPTGRERALIYRRTWFMSISLVSASTSSLLCSRPPELSSILRCSRSLVDEASLLLMIAGPCTTPGRLATADMKLLSLLFWVRNSFSKRLLVAPNLFVVAQLDGESRKKSCALLAVF